MKKKLPFIFIFIFIFIFSIVGCSRSTPITLKKADPVKTSTVANLINISTIPGFNKSTVIKPYNESIPVLEYHSISSDKNDPICIPIKILRSK